MSISNALILCGGTRGTGLEVARLARAEGRVVHALVRASAETAGLLELGCKLTVGDALERASLDALVADAPVDAPCVCTLGGDAGSLTDSHGVGQLAESLAATGRRRVVLVSSLGAGDSRPHASQRLLDAIGPVLELKTEGEDRARSAELDLTILRPGGLISGPASGRGTVYDDPRVHGRISREELARVIMACLHTSTSIGRTLSAVDADTLRAPAPAVPFPLRRLASSE